MAFSVEHKASQKNLWPFIKKYVDPETKVIYTDGGAWYNGVEKILKKGGKHKVQPHDKERYVDPDDVENHINCLENENR